MDFLEQEKKAKLVDLMASIAKTSKSASEKINEAAQRLQSNDPSDIEKAGQLVIEFSQLQDSSCKMQIEMLQIVFGDKALAMFASPGPQIN